MYISPAASEKIKKLPVTSLADLFQANQATRGYPVVTVRVSSPKYIDSVRTELTGQGVKVFAMADQLDEIKKGFLILDAFLLAVSMIGITVSSLGIINTMLMSVLERYREIGIFKALGATNRNIRMIFLFESEIIGLIGGLLGLILGYVVSLLITFIIIRVIKEVPDVNLFCSHFWLCTSAVLFSVVISLVSRTYPAMRASKVDPISALHHE
ncbi:MAG: FtsX-like permease family protein [Sedimentisphaerales bacterium]|nr:FtsX-like permease family protein [Sedimentisphaerales bacterium]